MKKNTYNTKVRNTSHFIPTHTYIIRYNIPNFQILLNNINISYSIKTHILSIQFTLLKSYTNPIVSRSYRLDLSFFEEERGIKIIFQFLGRGGGAAQHAVWTGVWENDKNVAVMNEYVAEPIPHL